MKRVSQLTDKEYEDYLAALVIDDYKAIQDILQTMKKKPIRRKSGYYPTVNIYDSEEEAVSNSRREGILYHRLSDDKWFANLHSIKQKRGPWWDELSLYADLEGFELLTVVQYRNKIGTLEELSNMFPNVQEKTFRINGKILRTQKGKAVSLYPKELAHGSKDYKKLMDLKVLESTLVLDTSTSTWYLSFIHAGCKTNKALKCLKENPNLKCYKILSKEENGKKVRYLEEFYGRVDRNKPIQNAIGETTV